MLATTKSKTEAVSKLESLIERGRLRAANVIDHVMRGHVSWVSAKTNARARVRGRLFALPPYTFSQPSGLQVTRDSVVHFLKDTCRYL